MEELNTDLISEADVCISCKQEFIVFLRLKHGDRLRMDFIYCPYCGTKQT